MIMSQSYTFSGKESEEGKNQISSGRLRPKHVKDEKLNTQLLSVTLDGV
jgi:hypothetical protein